MSYTTHSRRQKKPSLGEEGTSLSQVFQSASIGFGASLACALLLLLIGAMLCLRSEDPSHATLPMGLSALYLSALVGGIVSVRHRGRSALLCGALCGILLMSFFGIISLFFKEIDRFPFFSALLLRSLGVVFAIFGALLGRKRASRRLHRKR